MSLDQIAKSILTSTTIPLALALFTSEAFWSRSWLTVGNFNLPENSCTTSSLLALALSVFISWFTTSSLCSKNLYRTSTTLLLLFSLNLPCSEDQISHEPVGRWESSIIIWLCCAFKKKQELSSNKNLAEAVRKVVVCRRCLRDPICELGELHYCQGVTIKIQDTTYNHPKYIAWQVTRYGTAFTVHNLKLLATTSY